jgi:hypothetical protein
MVPVELALDLEGSAELRAMMGGILISMQDQLLISNICHDGLRLIRFNLKRQTKLYARQVLKVHESKRIPMP